MARKQQKRTSRSRGTSSRSRRRAGSAASRAGDRSQPGKSRGGAGAKGAVRTGAGARKGTSGSRRGNARGGTRTAARSRTTRRAAGGGARAGGAGGPRGVKWINSPDEHADRPGQTLATRNHDVIRRWAEERGGQPATTGNRHNGRPGVLRFDFPGYGGGSLEHVSWDEWFSSFDERELVFLYQERLESGRPGNFFRLDNPEREDA